MYQNAYVQRYQQNQIASASKEQILLMLYDGAIKFIRQARQGLKNGDRKQKGEGISRAVNIVGELDATLDFNIGGEIAENLDALYHFIIRQLTQGNLKDDDQALSVAESLLLDLRQTWEEAISSLSKKEEIHAAAAEKKIEDGGKLQGRLAVNG